MKIDTKKCLPLQQGEGKSNNEFLIHPNKYIPDDVISSSCAKFVNGNTNTVTATPNTVGTTTTMTTPPSAFSPNESSMKEGNSTSSSSSSSNDSSSGRKIMYLPKIIYTPVLTSERQLKNPEQRRRLVSEEDMNQLNKKLEDLFVGNNNHHDNIDDKTSKDDANYSAFEGKEDDAYDYDSFQDTIEGVVVPENFDKSFLEKNDVASDVIISSNQDSTILDIDGNLMKRVTFIDIDKKQEEVLLSKEFDKNEESAPSLLGRIYMSVFSYKTGDTVEVLRSARILENEMKEIGEEKIGNELLA